jgi:hypothetical protein
VCFGTGIGLLFLAVLGLFVDDDLRHLNAVKNVLALVSNGVAGVLFAVVAPFWRQRPYCPPSQALS